MIFTYLILKMTFGGVLAESNRLAAQQDIEESTRQLKSELLTLQGDYGKGLITERTYRLKEHQIMQNLARLTGAAGKYKTNIR
jgi:hypothetical protein